MSPHTASNGNSDLANAESDSGGPAAPHEQRPASHDPNRLDEFFVATVEALKKDLLRDANLRLTGLLQEMAATIPSRITDTLNNEEAQRKIAAAIATKLLQDVGSA